MGNRLSSLWCKKSTLQIADKNSSSTNTNNKSNKIGSKNHNNNNNKNNQSSFRVIGNYILKDKKVVGATQDTSATAEAPATPIISTIEQEFEKLIKNAKIESELRPTTANTRTTTTISTTELNDTMKIDVNLPTVKVSCVLCFWTFINVVKVYSHYDIVTYNITMLFV